MEDGAFKLIGRMVRDEWGRQLGMVISMLADDRGEMSWLLVRAGDGRVRRFRLSDVIVTDTDVVVPSGFRRRLRSLKRRAALLRHQEALFSNLNGDGVSQGCEGALEKERALIIAEARYLAKKISDACRRCNEQIRDLQRGMACLEVEHELGNVPDEVYKASMKIMMSDLRKSLAERDDLLRLRSELTALIEQLEGSAEPEAKENEPAGGAVSDEAEARVEAVSA